VAIARNFVAPPCIVAVPTLPWFGSCGASFVPAAHRRGRRAQARSRLGAMSCHFFSFARRRLDGAEHAGMLSCPETMAVADSS